jgi:hypothetical protein
MTTAKDNHKEEPKIFSSVRGVSTWRCSCGPAGEELPGFVQISRVGFRI